MCPEQVVIDNGYGYIKALGELSFEDFGIRYHSAEMLSEFFQQKADWGVFSFHCLFQKDAVCYYVYDDKGICQFDTEDLPRGDHIEPEQLSDGKLRYHHWIDNYHISTVISREQLDMYEEE
jgi:hypothetical protein